MELDPTISRVLGFLLATGAAFAVLTLVASFMRFHMLARQVDVGDIEAASPEDVFRLLVAREFGAFQQASPPFVVALIQPVDLEGLRERHGDEAVEFWVSALGDALKQSVRRADAVHRYHGLCYGVLARMTRAQSVAWSRRIADTLSRMALPAGEGLTTRKPLAIGVATYPDDATRTAELLQAAEQALQVALTDGATKVVYAGEQPAGSVSEEETAAQSSDILDEVTGVLRGDRLGTAMQKFVARQRKDDLPVSVIYLSIDYFAQYKDHYTEQASREILKKLADYLSDHTRETDIIARCADAEFALVLDCAPPQALVVAQRIVAGVKKMTIHAGSSQLKITISAGVAGFPDHSGQAQAMLSYAENAMYAAQSRGRNQCLLYQNVMPARQDVAQAQDRL